MVLSLDPEAMTLPRGEYEIDQIARLCPLSGSPMEDGLCAFHVRMVLSSEPDATDLPSGENTTERATSLWPSGGYSLAATFPAKRHTNYELSFLLDLIMGIDTGL